MLGLTPSLSVSAMCPWGGHSASLDPSPSPLKGGKQLHNHEQGSLPGPSAPDTDSSDRSLVLNPDFPVRLLSLVLIVMICL